MDKMDYILLLVIVIALILLILRLLFIKKKKKPENKSVKEKKHGNQRSDMRFDIPIDHSYESVNEQVRRNKTETHEYQQQDWEYQKQGMYDSGEEETVWMNPKQQFGFIDEDSTVVINGKKTNILLENIHNPDIAFKKEIGNELLIGRKPGCDIIIGKDKTISAKHCKIVKNQDEFFIEDCHSTNGTRLNNEQLVAIKKISTGDIVEIGQMRFRISIIVE